MIETITEQKTAAITLAPDDVSSAPKCAIGVILPWKKLRMVQYEQINENSSIHRSDTTPRN